MYIYILLRINNLGRKKIKFEFQSHYKEILVKLMNIYERQRFCLKCVGGLQP